MRTTAPEIDTSSLRKVVALRDLRKNFGLPWSESQVWRLVRRGALPEPFYLPGCRLALLFEDEVEPLIAEAAAVRGKRRAA